MQTYTHTQAETGQNDMMNVVSESYTDAGFTKVKSFAIFLLT